jgi:tripartite-type tricarboxylate transporter receptor subunit TctC
VAKPAVRTRLQEQGLIPVANTPVEFSAQIKRETQTWAQVIRLANIKME